MLRPLFVFGFLCTPTENNLKRKTIQNSSQKRVRARFQTNKTEQKFVNAPTGQTMVSNMNVEPRSDSIYTGDSNRSAFVHSAISQSSVEFKIIQPNMDCNELSKKMLKLDLSQRNGEEKGSFDSDEKAELSGVRSPKSPFSNSSRFLLCFFFFYFSFHCIFHIVLYSIFVLHHD